MNNLDKKIFLRVRILSWNQIFLKSMSKFVWLKNHMIIGNVTAPEPTLDGDTVNASGGIGVY